MTDAADARAGEHERRAAALGRRRRRDVASLGIIVLVVVVLFAAITARVFVWPDLPALPQHADAVRRARRAGRRQGRDALALQLATQTAARTTSVQLDESRRHPLPAGADRT